MKKSEPNENNKIDIIDDIFSEIEKDIQEDLSFYTNSKDDFGTAVRQIFIKEKAYRDSTLSRDSLMKRMNIGKSIFIKRFQYCFDMSFKECINRLRLKESAILLEQSDLSIEEIAEKVGFGTVRTFQRQFMAKYNVPPKEYRLAKYKNSKYEFKGK
ncbi:MAG: helix-turn-helix domain-containing protein [Dysgonomonas sp.]